MQFEWGRYPRIDPLIIALPAPTWEEPEAL